MQSKDIPVITLHQKDSTSLYIDVYQEGPIANLVLVESMAKFRIIRGLKCQPITLVFGGKDRKPMLNILFPFKQ